MSFHRNKTSKCLCSKKENGVVRPHSAVRSELSIKHLVQTSTTAPSGAILFLIQNSLYSICKIVMPKEDRKGKVKRGRKSKSEKKEKSTSNSSKVTFAEDGTPLAEKPAKRPVGRPRKYPIMTHEQKLEKRREEKRRVKEAKRALKNRPHERLENARILTILEMPPESQVIELDMSTASTTSTSSQLHKPLIQPCDTEWLGLGVALQQDLRDSLHSKSHYYIVHIQSPALPRLTPEEEQVLPESILRKRACIRRFYKIGPFSLPFFSSYYQFDITIAHRPEDEDLTDEEWGSIDRAMKEAPRAVVPGSLCIHVERAFDVWPPTAAKLVEIMSESFHGSNHVFRKLLLDNKLHTYRVGLVPKNRPSSQLDRDLRRSTEGIEQVNTTTVVCDMAHLERLLFRYHLEKHGKYSIDTKHDLLSTREMCYWAFREYFLGPRYFTFCQYFRPIYLVNLTPEALTTILPELKLDQESVDPDVVCSMVLQKFLRPDVNGGRFESGISLVRFINDHLQSEDVLRLILPPFADVKSFGKARKQQEASATTGFYHQTLFGVRQETTCRRDPTSLDDVALWYDTLRVVYLALVIRRYVENGDLFPSATIQPEDVEYAEFLIKTRFIVVYPHIATMMTAARYMQEHIALTKAQFEGASGTSLAFADTVRPVLKVKEPKTVARQLAPIPGAMGASSMFSIYPRMAALLAQTVIEGVFSTILSTYEVRVTEAVDKIVQLVYRESAGKIILRNQKDDYDEVEADSVHKQQVSEFLDQVSEAFHPLDLFGRNASLVTQPLERFLNQIHPSTDFLGTEYWSSLASRLVSLPQVIQSTCHGACFQPRIRDWRRNLRNSDNLSSVRQTALSLLHYPIVLIDYPFSYAEHKIADPDLLTLASELADYRFAPDDSSVLEWLTFESRLFSPLRSENRFVCIKQLEQWTLQQFKETLNTAFFNWRAHDMISGTGVLWIFVDLHALDLGCVSVLEEFCRERSHIKHISLRETIRVPHSSALENLAARISTEQLAKQSEEDYFILLRECDDETIEIEAYETDPVTGEDRLVSTSQHPLPTLSIESITELRTSDDHSFHPPYAKVYLNTIRDWRQLYTLTCYVSTKMILVGTRAMLDRIFETSLEDQHFTPVTTELIHSTSEQQLELVQKDGVVGRLRYAPTTTMDIWSSVRNLSAATSTRLPEGIHV